MPAPPPLRRFVDATRGSVSGLPRQFWWLWTSTLVNRLGAFVATFLAMYLTAERGHSATYAGMVAALYGAGGAVAAIGAGVLTDRLGRRPTLLLSQSGTALSVAALGFVEHPVAIAAVAALVGMCSNGSRPAVQAMMADIVAPKDRIRAFALNYWAINMGFAVSAAAAGLIAEHGYLWLFLGEAALTLTCAVLVFVKLPESRPERPAQPVGTASGPRPGSKGRSADVSMLTVLRDGRFMAVTGLSFLIATIFTQAYVSLPIAMANQGLTSADYGMAIAVNGVIIVLLQIPVTRFIEHRDPARLLVVSSLLVGYGFGAMAFTDAVGLYMLAICVWTLGEIINSPTQMGLVVRLSPTHGRGRYQGMFTLSWSLAALSAPLAGGAVIDRWGANTLWGALAVVGTLAAIGYGTLLRSLPPPTTAASGDEGGDEGGSDANAGPAAAGRPRAQAQAREH
ncbi:MDR family MFS transporter [Streptomyces alkaliterrae]|uniref:MFS transporter n=1 Tax=Streptomyces alkaliterrae TaxID=2213162 RepID=A0A5P0YWM4_9ACTN|nr:MFS transporter [Streptomyces alkaliterrae]MBB1261553.1 MFS transporter [Streptomyces alkaliterrae]MQS03892.1 MFS transporter [Streptomyces alkaliterrae]